MNQSLKLDRDKALEPFKQDQLAQMEAVIHRAGGSISGERLRTMTLDELFNTLNTNSIRVEFTFDLTMGLELAPFDYEPVLHDLEKKIQFLSILRKE